MAVHPEIAHQQDYIGSETYKRIRDQICDIPRAEFFLSAKPNWSSETISKWTRVPPAMVDALRLMRVGAIPNVGHRDLVWLLSRYAEFYGLDGMPEHSFPLGGRKRLVPDLVVLDRQRVHFVVEVKTELDYPVQVARAVAQVQRYRDVVGEGQPVVTAYQVDEREIDGVSVWPASRLRHEMRIVGQTAAPIYETAVAS